MAITTVAVCPICDTKQVFVSPDDFNSCRDALRAPACPLNNCITRERAAAAVLFSLFPREHVPDLQIHEAAPGGRGLSLWLWLNAKKRLIFSGYYPERPFGELINNIRNENLESQTFPDESFDIVIHLDVMEHLFNPFQALREIYRTLRRGGVCIFTAPTYAERERSEQVAFLEGETLRVMGEPEYHGNPQNADGALVTWRYGYDLPKLISEQTKFDVEVRRWQSRANAIMGPMTEVYLLRRSRE